MMENPLQTKNLITYTDKLGPRGSREGSILSKDSGFHSKATSVRESLESLRSSLRSEVLLPREIKKESDSTDGLLRKQSQVLNSSRSTLPSAVSVSRELRKEADGSADLLRSMSHGLASSKSSLYSEGFIPREINLESDSSSISSISILDRMKDLDSAPVKDQQGSEMYYDASPAVFSPRQSRGAYDSMIISSGVFPDTDSGFSSSFKGRLQSSDDFTQSPQISPGALVRARSNPRLNGSFISQEVTPFQNQFRVDRSIRNLQGNLEDSENRRCVLMHKLKEAQDTLELQSERLSKIENAAKGNTILVEDLKLKERDYRRKIDALELTEQEKDMLKMENIKLRQDMQDRIDKLDFALRSLQAQHSVAESENQKKIILLEQTGQALSMLENENTRLQQDKDSMRQEMAVAKEAIALARSKFEPMEEENKDLRVEVMKLKEENADLTKKVAELSGQLMELRKLTSSMKDENEKLAGSWKTLAEEKQKISKQLEASQEKSSEMKSKASAATAEKDRLFNDKMELNNKYQQLLVNKEQLDRKSCVLEEQVRDVEAELTRAKQVAQKRDENKRFIEEELQDYKKANQDLSSELSSVKAFYERALEQISTLENGKKVQQQQHDWATQEQERLKAEVDRLGKVAEGKSKELKREKEEMEELIQNLKSELRNIRNEKSLTEDKVEELETKLHKANEDIKYSATVSQEELDTWKDTCDRLTASVSRKESEIQALSEKCLDLEDLTAKLQGENRGLKDECEQLGDKQEDIKKLKDENRKMLREKAENEQMIKLLETQKEVLTKSSESQLAKLHDIEQLTSKVEQFRNENEHLRERVLELEKVRDNLVNQKEELLASTELIYKKPKLEELEQKVEELREANRQLRNINESTNEKYEALEQKLSESNTAPFSQEVNVFQNQSKPQKSKSVSNVPLTKSSISGVAGVSPPKTLLSQRSRSLPYPPMSGKMSVMNSRLGPVLVGEDVVYENDLNPGDDSNIIIDPKLGPVLVSKQEVPFSGFGHVLIGKRVISGSKLVSDRDRKKIPSKFGPVLMKEKVVFEDSLKAEEREKIIDDPEFGKVLVIKTKDPKSSSGYVLIGKRVLTKGDLMKFGKSDAIGTKYDIKSFRSRSADSRTSLDKDIDVIAQTRNQVYVDSEMGPVLVDDQVILESQLTSDNRKNIIFDSEFGNMLVTKMEVPGEGINEILVGKRVVSDLEVRQKQECEIEHSCKGSEEKKFINTELGPILLDTNIVQESEILAEDRENVITIPEVGTVLVKRQTVVGSVVDSVLVGQRVCLGKDKEKKSKKVIDSRFGQVFLAEEGVNECDIMSGDEDFILEIPDIGSVLVSKEIVPDSEVRHVLVARKIVSGMESKSQTVRQPGSIRPSLSDARQKIVESGIGPILISEQIVHESDLEPKAEETVVIDPELGPILVSKHITPGSDLGHVLVGKVIVSENKQSGEDKHVIHTPKGPILVSGTVIDSDISMAEAKNIVDDPTLGRVLITKDMVRDDKLGYVGVGKKVVSPLKSSSGKSVIVDTKLGSVMLSDDVLMESDLSPEDFCNVIHDPKHGKLLVTLQTLHDRQKGLVKIGKSIVSGTKAENVPSSLRRTISNKKYGKIEVGDQCVLETDLTAADKRNVIVDPKLGTVLVTKKTDDRLGSKYEGKIIVACKTPYLMPSATQPKDKKYIKDRKFGNVFVGDDILFESEVGKELKDKVIIHPELGAILVTDQESLDPKVGKFRIGKRIVCGKRIPKRSTPVVKTQKGAILVSGEVVMAADLKPSEKRNVIETEFGPVLLTNKSVCDAKHGKVLVGKRIVTPSTKFDAASRHRIVVDSTVGPISLDDSLILETDISPADVKKIIHHPTEGPILVTKETVLDPEMGTVFVGKKVVNCKEIPKQKEVFIESKRGPVLLKEDPVLQSKLTESERENVFLHPEFGPLLVTKEVTEDSGGRQVLVGKRIAEESTKFGADQSKGKIIQHKEHGRICIGDHVVYESELSSADMKNVIYDPKFGALLVTREKVADLKYGKASVAKQIVQGQNETKMKQFIDSREGVVMVGQDVVFPGELSSSEKERIVLDPKLGGVLLTDNVTIDPVRGKVRIGKRIVSPILYPMKDEIITCQRGPVLVSAVSISEAELSPSERENIVLDKTFGSVLLTEETINSPLHGEVIVGKRIIPSQDKGRRVIHTTTGKILVDENIDPVLDSSLTAQERENIIMDPKLGLVLVTKQVQSDPMYGRLLVGKKVIQTVRDQAGSKVIQTVKGPIVLAQDKVPEAGLSTVERESVVIDPMFGPVLITDVSVDVPNIGKVKVGKKLTLKSERHDGKKTAVDTSYGKVLIGDSVISESELTNEERGSVVLDPVVGPVLVTKEIIEDPKFGQCLIGKQVLLSKRGANGEKLINSSQGNVLVGQTDVLESELSPMERECVVFDAEIGPVLVTPSSIVDPIVGRALTGRRVILSRKDKSDQDFLQTTKGTVQVSHESILESELSTEERECIVLDPDIDPVLLTSQIVRDPLHGKVKIGKKVIMDKTDPGKQKILHTKDGNVLVGQQTVFENELTEAERECVVLDPDLGPVLITKQVTEDPEIGRALVGKPIILSQKSPSSKKVVKVQKGQVLVAETSVSESDLSPSEKESIILDPELGPVFITKETVLDPKMGYATKGRKVVLCQRDSPSKFIDSSKGKVLVGLEEVDESFLTLEERENVVIDPIHGPVLVTKEIVEDSTVGQALVGKRIIMQTKTPSEKIRLSTSKGSVLVGDQTELQSDMSPLERESVVLDPDLGPVLITKLSVPDPVSGQALVGKKVILNAKRTGEKETIQTKEGIVLIDSKDVLESEIGPTEWKRIVFDETLGKVLLSKSKVYDPKFGYVLTGQKVISEESVNAAGKKVIPNVIKTDHGPVLVGEQVVHESEVEPSDTIIMDQSVGPVLITRQTVPHKEMGRVLVGKRILTGPRRRSSSLKYLERVKLSTDYADQGKFVEQETVVESPAQFYIQSEFGPVYVEKIFAPGTEKGFVLKGTLTPDQTSNMIKGHKNEDVVLETELGPIFIETSVKSDVPLTFADLEEVVLIEPVNLVFIPKGRLLPATPTATSEMTKHQLIADSSVFDKMVRKSFSGDFVSKAIQTLTWPLMTVETQTVLDSEAMTFLTGKFYYEENIELKEAIGGDGTVVPKYDLERVKDEKNHLENELDQVRREYDGLKERHEQYMADYGPDGEETQKEHRKIAALEREKEGLEKQVALINGQLLLVEGSKKRLDEVVEDLQQEIVHLRKELEEAEKQPVSGPELDHLQSEVEDLRNELTRSQKEKVKQDYMLKTLKEELDEERNKKPTKIRESLDDVGTELNEMRGELHTLMGVIQSKDQAIETLENQLRQSKEKIEDKDKAMLEMKSMMKESSHSAEDPLRKAVAKSKIPMRKSAGDESKGSGQSSESLRKPNESKLIKRLKPADSYMQMQRSQELSGSEGDLSNTSVTPGLYGAKYVGSKPQRTSSLTEKGSGDRLQSLISKYRSYGDTGGQVPERKIKPLSLSPSNKMGLVTRGRSFGPAAPKSDSKDGKVPQGP